MPDRTINWGDPADAGTTYRTQDDDPTGGGNFVVAEDTDGNTVLLQWNPTTSQWEYGGPIDMGGNDITNVGTASVTALEAEKVNIGTLQESVYLGTDFTASGASDNIIPFDSTAQDDTGNFIEDLGGFDKTTGIWTVQEDGYYFLNGMVHGDDPDAGEIALGFFIGDDVTDSNSRDTKGRNYEQTDGTNGDQSTDTTYATRLSSGTEVAVYIRPNLGGSDLTVRGKETVTNLQITRLG